MFSLHSVSAMTTNLDISASGWPPCPASTGTSYTVTTQVTGTVTGTWSGYTYLWIGIYDYVNNKWVASTESYIGPYNGASISVTKSFAITTNQNPGDINYGAYVQYYDWDQSKWVWANHVDSGPKTSGTPSVDAFGLSISPTPRTLHSPTKDTVAGEKNVTLTWAVSGHSNGLNIVTQAYHWEYKDSSWKWVYIGTAGGGYKYVTSITGSFVQSFSLSHKPTHAGTNYYYVAAWYWNWCSNSWTGYDYSEITTVNVACDAVTYQPNAWNVAGSDSIGCSNIQEANNCYNYGTDIQMNNFAQPGEASSFTPMMTCAGIREAAKLDGLSYVDMTGLFTCGDSCSHKVALAIDSVLGDYHWYREDGTSGYWSHKRGWSQATDTVNAFNDIWGINSSKITNPDSAADFIRYNDFCGYFCAIKPKVNIKGHKPNCPP